MWTQVTDRTTLATKAHQVAELVTVALAELSLARQSETSGPEFEGAVERAEIALRRVREPLQRLTTELASEKMEVEGNTSCRGVGRY
jgi:hypothetical protein